MKTNFEILRGGQSFRRCIHTLSALLLVPCLFLSVAKGGVRITVIQLDGAVSITATGNINLAALTQQGGAGGLSPRIKPQRAQFALGLPSPPDGPVSPFMVFNYRATFGGVITRPTNFGTGGLTSASSGAGDKFGYTFPDQDSSNEQFHFIQVPAGYVSGAPLSSSATFDGATIASLGMTPGEYKWSWGTEGEADYDSITLVVSTLQGTIPPTVDNTARKLAISSSIAKLKRQIVLTNRSKLLRPKRDVIVARLKRTIAALTKTLRRL